MIPATPPMAPMRMRCCSGSSPATGTEPSTARAVSAGTVTAQKNVDIDATPYRSASRAPIDVAARATASRPAAGRRRPAVEDGRLSGGAVVTAAGLLGLLVDVGQHVVEQAGALLLGPGPR